MAQYKCERDFLGDNAKGETRKFAGGQVIADKQIAAGTLASCLRVGWLTAYDAKAAAKAAKEAEAATAAIEGSNDDA